MRPAAEPIGLHPLRDGKLALGVALAFGQADADKLSRLAVIAGECGAGALRPAPGRALLLVGLDHDGAEHVASVAHQLGFITRADDPRRRIAACAGKPACASAFLPTRALAAAVARHLPRLDGAITLHISGCPKGCAHPAPAALTIVGDARGAGLVRNGSAAATLTRYLGPDDLIDEITRAMQMSEADHG
jgi:precorrin-3B synthase